MIGRFSTSALIGYVAFITIAFAVGRAVAMTAFLPWQQEYIPDQMRGRVSGYSSIIISLAGLVAVGIASYVLERPLGIWRYSLLFGIGVVFGIVSILLASQFPGGRPSRTNGLPVPHRQKNIPASAGFTLHPLPGGAGPDHPGHGTGLLLPAHLHEGKGWLESREALSFSRRAR